MFDQIDDFLPKTVNVVGNASSILTKNNGHLIDQYTTIRFNRTIILNKSAQGQRWDFLASSEKKTFIYYNKGPGLFHSLIFLPSVVKHVANKKFITFNTNLFEIPVSFFQPIRKILNQRPSTGLQVLLLLDYFKKNVNIFGFDFNQTKTFYDLNRIKPAHNFEKEKLIIEKMVEKNRWNMY